MPSTVSIPEAELPPGQRKLVFIDGRSVAVFNIDGRHYAIDNSCPHQGASLANGRLDGTWLQCPAHGLRFNLAADDAAGLCLTRCTVTAANGAVTVTLESPPSMA